MAVLPEVLVEAFEPGAGVSFVYCDVLPVMQSKLPLNPFRCLVAFLFVHLVLFVGFCNTMKSI